MFELIKTFFKNVAKKALKTKPNYTLPFQQTNFDFSSLCPNTVTSDQLRIEWLEVYLENSPKNSVLLWADNANQLNIVFRDTHTQSIQHRHLPAYEVHPQTKNISLCLTASALTKDALQQRLSELHSTLPIPYHLPSENELKKLKFKVHLAKKVITKELYTALEQDTRTALDNIELCNQCNICLENFSKENPPVVTQSGFVSHKPCIDRHLSRQYEQGFDLTCPNSGTVLFRNLRRPEVPFNVDSLTHPELSYNAMLGNVEDLVTNTEKMKKMLEVLLKENEELKAKLAALSHDSSKAEESRPILHRLT